MNEFLGPQPNPGSLHEAVERASEERKRIPMSVPRRRLQCQSIPGFHLYWAREDDVDQFVEAGYEFVSRRETRVNYRDYTASPADADGNQDLGDRVKVWAGRGENGAPYYHVLMKIRLAWYEEDQRAIRNHNAKILQAIFRGEVVIDTDAEGSSKGGDTSNRYVDKEKTSFHPGRAPESAPKSLFQRPVRKHT